GAARRGERPGVRHTPGPAQYLDLVLVLVIDRLALDVAELREDVRCQHDLPRVTPQLPRGPYGFRRQPVKDGRAGGARPNGAALGRAGSPRSDGGSGIAACPGRPRAAGS